jgi:Arc/MetJ family transcription regulator
VDETSTLSTELFMSMTNLDIDDAALAEVMRLTGCTTKKDTVNTVLRDYVARVKRLEALDALSERAERGDFDNARQARENAKRARRDAFQ